VLVALHQADSLPAAQACAGAAMHGGSLTSRMCTALQADVEEYFVTNGFLFPEFNQFYWMGLNASTSAGPWAWISPDVPSSQIGAYKHWVTGQPAAGAMTCGAGNWNTTFGGAWGWMNKACSEQYVSICRINRERRAITMVCCWMPPQLHGPVSQG
jgi:hypothetical protein